MNTKEETMKTYEEVTETTGYLKALLEISDKIIEKSKEGFIPDTMLIVEIMQEMADEKKTSMEILKAKFEELKSHE